MEIHPFIFSAKHKLFSPISCTDELIWSRKVFHIQKQQPSSESLRWLYRIYTHRTMWKRDVKWAWARALLNCVLCTWSSTRMKKKNKNTHTHTYGSDGRRAIEPHVNRLYRTVDSENQVCMYKSLEYGYGALLLTNFCLVLCCAMFVCCFFFSSFWSFSFSHCRKLFKPEIWANETNDNSWRFKFSIIKS